MKLFRWQRRFLEAIGVLDRKPVVRIMIMGTVCPEPRDPEAKHFRGALFARRGEMIMCSGDPQHPIAMFVRDVRVGELFDNTAIGCWTQPPPAIGDTGASLKCRECGAPFWSDNHFHFKGGWR